jgi:uncharacterized protein (TIRG00374 family)
MKHNLRRTLLLFVSLAVLALTLYLCDPGSIVSNLSSLDIGYVPLLVFVFSTSTALRIVKWKVLLDKTMRVPLATIIPVQLAGFLLRDVSPARIAELSKVFFLKKVASIPVSKSTKSMVVDRINDMLVLSLLSIMLLYNLAYKLSRDMFYLSAAASATLVLASISVIVFLKLSIFRDLLKKYSRKIPYLGRYITTERVEAFYGSRVGKAREVFSLLMTFTAIMVDGLLFHFIFVSMCYVGVPFYHYAMVFSFAVVCGFLTFLPGGVGSVEAIFIAVMMLYGVDKSIAASGILVYRSFSLVYMFVAGSASLVYMNRKKNIPLLGLFYRSS